MDFGKLMDISQVDFVLPKEAQRNSTVLQSASSGEEAQVYVGSAQWTEKSLLGKIYPTGTPQKDYLHHYARQFNTVEMNTTHYRIPTQPMVQQWKEKVPDRFRFCPKLPQNISHSPDFGERLNATQLFQEALYNFGDHLGIPFMQLPPTFEPHRDGKKLFHYLKHWPQDLPLAVEFRHPAWFSDAKIKHRAFDLLQEYGLATVITDTAGRRDVVHMEVTHTRQAVRFVGNSLHPTDYSRLDAWVKRIDIWIQLGLKELYFFIHQPKEHLCVDLSIYFIQQLNEKLGLAIQPPRPVQQSVQKSLF